MTDSENALTASELHFEDLSVGGKALAVILIVLIVAIAFDYIVARIVQRYLLPPALWLSLGYVVGHFVFHRW